MAFQYTQDDIARNIVVEEKVTLPFEVVNYEEKPNKDSTSINHVVSFKCLAEGPYQGMIITQFYSEKYPAGAFPFLRAMGANLERGGGSVRFEVFKGRRCLIEVKPGTYNNQPANEVLSFRPIEE